MNEKPDKSAKKDWRQSRKKRLQIAVAGVAGSTLVHALGMGVRMQCMSWDLLNQNRLDNKGMIIALFHGKHFPVMWGYRKRGVYAIISRSADGEILTRVLKSLGFGAVRGSSTRGGARAMIGMAKLVDQGVDVAITVDGPRGPRHHVKAGAIQLSKMTGAPIIPVGAAMSRRWQFNSWDRYQLPKPGSRAMVVVEDLMLVPQDADDQVIEQYRQQLEKTMIDLDAQVEQVIGDRDACDQLIKQQEAIVWKHWREKIDGKAVAESE